MEQIIVEDIVPILVIMILGYVCGKLSYFDDDQRQGLNKLVLNIALPAALFVSIVKASREMLFSDLTLTILSVVGIVGMFMLSYFLCRKLFHHTMQEAAVCAMIAGSPTIGFLGFAVLDPIYGGTTETNLVIGIVSIVVNAITLPIGFYLINRGQQKAMATAMVGPSADPKKMAEAEAKAGAPATAKPIVTDEEAKGTDHEISVSRSSNKGKKKPEPTKNSSAAAVLNALKQPVVWSPILAVLLVLVGIHVPTELDPCFDLIAKANSGVAVLAAGLALSTVKFSFSVETWWNTFFRLILTPAVFVAAAVALGMAADPAKMGMLIMAVALPPAFSGIIVSSRYNIYVKEGASSVAVSTVGFAVTCLLWVWLVPVVCHLV